MRKPGTDPIFHSAQRGVRCLKNGVCPGFRSRIIVGLRTKNHAMEADRLNAIDNNLHGLTARAAELRRYL